MFIWIWSTRKTIRVDWEGRKTSNKIASTKEENSLLKQDEKELHLSMKRKICKNLPWIKSHNRLTLMVRAFYMLLEWGGLIRLAPFLTVNNELGNLSASAIYWETDIHKRTAYTAFWIKAPPWEEKNFSKRNSQ